MPWHRSAFPAIRVTAPAICPKSIPQNTLQISDTISYTKGAHSFRFGGSVVHNRFGFFQLGAPSGSLSFTGTYTNNPANSAGGNGFADFLLGLAGEFLQIGGAERHSL